MSKPTLREFLDQRGLIALKLSSSELSGLLRKRLVLPRHTRALAMFPDGAVALFGEGQEISGRFDLLIAKEGDIPLSFSFDGLRSSDGYPVAASLDMTVRLLSHRDDLLRDFSRAFFNFPGAYSSDDLRSALSPDLRRIVSDLISRRTAAELHRRDLPEDARSALDAALERLFFATGVGLVRLGAMTLDSRDFADRTAAAERREAEQRRHEERQSRREERVRRIAEFLQSDPMRGLLEKIPDSRARALLVAKLMQDDSIPLTPRDLAGRLTGGDELSRLLMRTLEELLATAPGLEPPQLEDEAARRIYAAVGNAVIEIDPSAPDGPPRLIRFRDPLRSVRVAEIDGAPALLVGGKRTVHIASLASPDDVREYLLPDGPEPRGGVNSVAVVDGYVFATHSEYGVLRWDRAKPGAPGIRMHPDLTSRHRTTRGAAAAGGALYFASGSTAFAAPLGDGEPVAYASGLDALVTALTVGGGWLFAGTEAGTIVGWKLGEPGQPALVVRGREPLVTLRAVRLRGIPHLLYSARDRAVRARVIGQALETSYESGGPSVGVIDAASDLICAADAAGRRLMLWRPGDPGRPVHEIELGRHSDRPVLDLGLSKTKAETATT